MGLFKNQAGKIIKKIIIEIVQILKSFKLDFDQCAEGILFTFYVSAHKTKLISQKNK